MHILWYLNICLLLATPIVLQILAFVGLKSTIYESLSLENSMVTSTIPESSLNELISYSYVNDCHIDDIYNKNQSDSSIILNPLYNELFVSQYSRLNTSDILLELSVSQPTIICYRVYLFNNEVELCIQYVRKLHLIYTILYRDVNI